MMKKLLLMCLMSVMCLSQSFADSKFSGGQGTEENPYLISTPEDLVQLSKDVDKENNYKGKFFKVTNDIDMSDIKNFLPIGNNFGSKSAYKAFSGTFDGADKIIKNLIVDYSNKGYMYQGIGFFGIAEDAIIKNVRLEDSYFIGYAMVAPIIAVSFGSTIQNCHSGKNVTAVAEMLGAAGITSFVMLKKGIIEDCSSAATVTAHYVQGGTAGGIIATVSEGAQGTVIRRCVNFGKVTSDADCCAGILALPEFPAVVEDCANFGKITSAIGAVGISYIAPKPQANHLVVRNCYNFGEMIGLESNVDAVCLGNIFTGGGEESCKVENCYYASDIPNAKSTTATAVTLEEMKSLEFVNKLNNGRTDGPWRINMASEHKMPVPFDYVLPTGIENVTVNASSAAISYNAGIVTVAGVNAGEKISVVDMSGRTVMMTSAQNEGELTIDVTSLPAGVYVIGNGSSSIKIVK